MSIDEIKRIINFAAAVAVDAGQQKLAAQLDESVHQINQLQERLRVAEERIAELEGEVLGISAERNGHLHDANVRGFYSTIDLGIAYDLAVKQIEASQKRGSPADEEAAYNDWTWNLKDSSEVFNCPSVAAKAAWMARAQLCAAPVVPAKTGNDLTGAIPDPKPLNRVTDEMFEQSKKSKEE